MSLISEKERIELEKLPRRELKEKGFKKVNNLKPALRKEIFYTLAENSPLEALKLLQEKGMNYSVNTLESYRGALTVNNLVKSYKNKGRKTKEELLEFLRKNPEVTFKDIQKEGYWSTLSYHYKCRINLAKKEAGVPENYIHQGFPPKKNKKPIIHGLILSTTKPLYPEEIADIVKLSKAFTQKYLIELYAERKIVYKNILGDVGRGRKYKDHDLFDGSWKDFGKRKIAYDPNNPNHLHYIAREIAKGITQGLGKNITRGERIALSHRLKLLPENLRILIESYLPC